MKENNFPNARQRDIVVQTAKDETLVYDLKTNKVYCLNETSAAIWQLCNGKNDIAEIAKQIQTQSNQQIPLEIVELALEKLSKENLLENYQPQLKTMDKKSRREMIRRIGLATMVALPVITSIVAPVSAAATSCPAGLTFCSSNSLFGFPRPVGCYDLQNGYTVPAFPPGVIGCQFCNAVCLGAGMGCVGGACVPV